MKSKFVEMAKQLAAEMKKRYARMCDEEEDGKERLTSYEMWELKEVTAIMDDMSNEGVCVGESWM